MLIDYVEGTINEFDIGSANISILTETGYIDDELYWDLLDGPKDQRVRMIGILIGRYSEVYDVIKENVDKYVEQFIRSNRIPEENILEVSKDAVFTINVKPKRCSFGEYVQFVKKQTFYSSLEIKLGDGDFKVKLYLDGHNDIVSRYSKINVHHPLYTHLVDVMRFKLDGSNKLSSTIKKMQRAVNRLKPDEGNLVTAIDNHKLMEVMIELAVF